MIELDYQQMSRWCFIAGIVAIFFRHYTGAGALFAGAVLGPMVGRVADMFMAAATYLFFGAIALGLIGAWYLIRWRFKLPDDGTLLSIFKRRKDEPGDGT